MQDYELLIERIAKLSGIDKEEVDKRVNAKRAKLSGLISKEGAAQIIASELGVSFDNLELKISELAPGMKKVNIIGKVVNIFPVREFNKNNRQGKVVNLIIADETSNIRIVLWDTNHIELIEKGKILKDDVIEIRNAAMRESEVHLSGFSEIKKSALVIENVRAEQSFAEREILDVQENQRVTLRGVIVQMFNPRFFYVCPECNKKAVQGPEGFSCAEHGRVACKERAILNLVLDDGTETIRVVLFSEQVNKLIDEQALKDPEKVIAFRDNIFGSEVFVSGTVKKNVMFSNL